MNKNGAPETVSEVCDGAADFIETHGWHQGAMYEGWVDPDAEWVPGMAVCALGGLLGACGELRGVRIPRDDRVLDAAEAFERYVGACGPGIGEWNDAPERTADEVVQALRDTATKWRDDAMTVES